MTSSVGEVGVRGPRPSTWISRQIRALAAAWKRGERPTAADIIATRPNLDDEAAVRLIFEEACLGREAGLVVDTSEVVRRYPRWSSDLRTLFDCDRLLRPAENHFEPPKAGEKLGSFLLIEELGRGAVGRTFLAEDPTLADRPVVIKVIPGHHEEHLALAKLRHPHIVPLFSQHAFVERGLRGLCMPYLGGASLEDVLGGISEIPIGRRSGRDLLTVVDRRTRENRRPPPAEGPSRRGLEGADYVEGITWIASCLADALAYAHARGLVHMDLKPSNVLVTADGRPMLLDFHLARAPIVSEEEVSGSLGGTPGWMAPEQEAAMYAVAAGDPSPFAVDGRADIYSLGLILKHALTDDVAPRTGRARSKTAEFRRPRCVSVGLAEIARKCLEFEPANRYRDAGLLAEDLRRQLNDLPLAGVKNRDPIELCRKWRRRHPGAFAWSAAILSLAVAGAALSGASISNRRQQISRLRAELVDGMNQRLSGNPVAAIGVLTRALESSRTVPGASDLSNELRHEIRLAERARASAELRRIADLVRYRHAADLPDEGEARSLMELCRAVFKSTASLLDVQDAQADLETSQRIRMDYLELAAISVDLLLRPGKAASVEAKREATRLLSETESLLGGSFALSLRREAAAKPGESPRADVIARLPRTAWEHYDLGRYYLRDGRTEAADEQFRAAIDLNPRDFWAHFHQGICAYRLNRHEEAAAAFRTCAALDPDSAVCRYDRALALEASGKIGDALHEYSKAIELDPKLVEARLNRGILLFKKQSLQESVLDFEQSLSHARDPSTLGRIHYNLALAQLALKNRSGAISNAEKALRLGYPEAAVVIDRAK